MSTRNLIFNRAPLTSTDGWLHIVPKGELPNSNGKIVQILDDEAIDSILAGIEKDKNRLGDKWPGIYAGREHFIYDSSKDSAALGWFKEFQKRDDGIWANEDGLTPAGAAAVKNREYKFTSFVSDPSDLEKISGNKFRVKRIETVGFTNYSNGGSATREGHELLTPITNRGQNTFAGVSAPAANQNNKLAALSRDAATKTRNNMLNIATKLGLAAEASEDAILAEVTKLQNRVTELTPLADENTKLKNRLTEVDSQAVAALLASHGVKDAKVLNRLTPVVQAAPAPERAALLADLGFKPVEAAKPATKVLNRGGGAEAVAESATAGADEKTVAQKIKNRAAELKGASPNRSFDSCWSQAIQETAAKN